MLLRLIKLMLKVDREIEGFRDVLFSHKTFNCVDCFRVFDKEDTGKISVEALEEGFAKWNIEILNLENLSNLIRLADSNEDGEISYSEFSRAVTPRNHECREQNNSIYETQRMSVEQRNVNQQAWMESLAGLFGAMISGEASLEEKREKLQLDAERLFDSMDVYKQGSLSLNIFSNWIQDNCCYNLKQSELVSLQSRFDKNNDYRITKEQFVEAVSALQEEEEQEVDEETGDNVAKAEAK